MVRRLTILPLAVLAAASLGGCEPAPSTPLAPEQKMPDISKMSPDQVDKLLKGNGPPGRK